MSVLLELAVRCEAATGPDRRIDGTIYAEVERPLPNDPDRNLRVFEAIVAKLAGGGDDSEVPAYTATIDAAMTLVPEGCDRWVVAFVNDEVTGPEYISGIGGDRHHRTGATPALALCAAALRARATGEQP